LLGNLVWILRRVISASSDNTEPENELTLVWGAIRILLTIAMMVCFAASAILFFNWVRSL
jgi:hypothetical protein